MATRTIAVVSAGLSVPSSTRLLADRLAGRDRRGPARARRRRHRRGRRAARACPRPGRQPGHRVPEREPAGGAGHGGRRRRPDRRHADLLRLLQRAVQDVLRRGRQGRAERQARPAGRDGRDRAALLALEHALRPLFAYLRTIVVPTAVFAAARTGARVARRTVTWSGGSSVPRASSPTSSLVVRRPWRPTRSPPRRRSRRCSAAPDPARHGAGAAVSAARPNRSADLPSHLGLPMSWTERPPRPCVQAVPTRRSALAAPSTVTSAWRLEVLAVVVPVPLIVTTCEPTAPPG